MRTDDWRPMDSAPKNSTNVRLLLKNGQEVVGHFAEDLSGEEQPAFSGWFKQIDRATCVGVVPVGWKPL